MPVVFSQGTNTLNLKSPEFGDSESPQLNTEVGVAMDGSFTSYVKTPLQRIHNMSFSSLTRSKMRLFENFLIATQGAVVQFIDTQSVLWEGYITSDPNEFTTDGRGRGTSERREEGSVNIIFEGSKV